MFSPILRQLDLANSLTLTGLFLSFFTVVAAANGKFNLAIILLIYAGIIDLFDGFIASKVERNQLQAEAGKQLDSLVDLCSFGFAPALFAYCFGLRDWLSIAILILYLGANALRLAYFNHQGLADRGEQEYFTGLPVTYAALFIPLFFTASFVLPQTQMKFVLDAVYLLLAIAMVADFKMLKLRGIWYGIFAVGAVALTGVYGWAIIARI
jgi:CDP-diacylglycerol---serine O-phosphatidyltransferase